MTYLRRDVWELAPDDPTIVHYRSAVEVMRSREPTDPTSWAFQADMHGSHVKPKGWPYNQCKHATWFFLPWHRMYLWFFEEIVRAAIPDRAAAADWALPYWDYGTGSSHATLPRPFRDAQVGGQTNALYEQRRAAGMNDGTGAIPRHVGYPAAALNCRSFTGPTPTERAPEFGGGPSDPAIQFARWTGTLENTPHNLIHDLVGGNNGGLMADPDLAAQDPVFWVHHANIDRIWSQWLAQDQGRADPSDGAWRSQAFKFYDPDGKEVTLTCAQVMDTDGGALSYRYQPPAAGAPAPPTQIAALAMPPDAGEEPSTPELVGASSTALELTGSRADLTVTIDARAASQVLGTAAAPSRVLLTIEEIETDADPGTSYDIYLNLPGDADDQAAAAHYAGAVSFFGAKRAANPRGDEAPHSIVISHNITQVVATLRSAGEWNDERVEVTFQPIGLDPVPSTPADTTPAASSPGGHPPVTIGQVAILYS